MTDINAQVGVHQFGVESEAHRNGEPFFEQPKIGLPS